ncbi:MAG TPA: hypothetical protein H9857_06255, partial [Candidatus Desulfovibrio intestinigallinarum]|nr:hypothetical protein [Candidatus Desulfovibrio intestinigallinarum]
PPLPSAFYSGLSDATETLPFSIDRRLQPYLLEHFQFEMFCISNHTACRFAEKTRFFRSLWAGRRCAATSRFTFLKLETL